MTDNPSGSWGGKPITGLSNAVLLIAEQDVANCMAKLGENPPAPKADYLARLQALATAITTEKTARGMT